MVCEQLKVDLAASSNRARALEGTLRETQLTLASTDSKLRETEHLLRQDREALLGKSQECTTLHESIKQLTGELEVERNALTDLTFEAEDVKAEAGSVRELLGQDKRKNWRRASSAARSNARMDPAGRVGAGATRA